MKLSLNWLSDYTDLNGVGIKEYCDKMTDTGSKAEGYETFADDIENVVAARILKITPHENSDHLLVCSIDAGRGDPVQIVTGAANIFEGAIVPAALPVAKLPGGVVIKSGKLRGVESHGMLCSAAELGLTEHEMPGAGDGILILGEEFTDKIGMCIKEALMLSDTAVEFEITSNRPDCLSVMGLARESALAFGRELKTHTPKVSEKKDGDSIDKYLSVQIDSPKLCHRYMARIVKNVKIAPSPLWLRMRLRSSGVRPINNIVDITNYVMLEYGQPMHAFDYTQLDGSSIIVRNAADNEIFRSLDDNDHMLDPSMLVIADCKKAVALAGVMGGANSEIKENTTVVVFESANFLGTSVRTTSKKNGMRTESSSRFEKGLDPENCAPALERAIELVNMLGAGEVVSGVIDVYPTKPEKVILDFNPAKINNFLATDLTDTDMEKILTSLGFEVRENKLTVPTFRADVRKMCDVAEEIARIYGYNNIKSGKIRGELTCGGRTAKQNFKIAMENVLVGMGLSQIQTFSFISPKYYDKINLVEDSLTRKSVVITNPLGEDTSVMRTTAAPSMLEVLKHNYSFKNETAELFEIATVYLPTAPDKLPEENKVICVGIYGGGCDFYSVKGICENLLRTAKDTCLSFKAVTSNPLYHPGRCAEVYMDDIRIGILGQVHPSVAENYEIDSSVFLAELDFEKIFEIRTVDAVYRPLPKFPATSRDFSFLCDKLLEVGTVEDVMRRAGGALVESVSLFDVYTSEKLGADKKSLSIRVSMRASDRTLLLEDAEKISGKILAALKNELGISLRD